MSRVEHSQSKREQPDADVVAVNYGYTCRYTPTIMDGPVYRWGRLMSASRNGVMVHESGVMDGTKINQFCRLLAIATVVHEMLLRDDRSTYVVTEYLKRAENAEGDNR